MTGSDGSLVWLRKYILRGAVWKALVYNLAAIDVVLRKSANGVLGRRRQVLSVALGNAGVGETTVTNIELNVRIGGAAGPCTAGGVGRYPWKVVTGSQMRSGSRLCGLQRRGGNGYEGARW
jgi:class 3 adenylate cyclase